MAPTLKAGALTGIAILFAEALPAARLKWLIGSLSTVSMLILVADPVFFLHGV